jgi:uncharacterized membrane protein SirB2
MTGQDTQTMPYLAIKHFHVAIAGLALLFYLLRGVLMILDSPWLASKSMRVLPHVFYTLLVLAGAALATLSGQWGQGWIWLKLALLVAFVALGFFAFRPASTLARGRRIGLWGLGLLVLLAIFGVAGQHRASLMSAPAGAAATDAAPPPQY